MTNHCYETRKTQFQKALNRVWRIAREHDIPLHTSTGFFTPLDWQQLADEEITDEALHHVMVEIASNPAFREQIDQEQRN